MTTTPNEKAKRDQEMSFNQVIASLIDNSRLTQKEIAQRMGMPMPNIITMWKQGQTKVPPERVPAMAKALNADAKWLLMLNLRERYPELIEVIDEILGFSVTENEKAIILALRKHTHDSNPQMIKSDQLKALEDFAKTLME